MIDFPNGIDTDLWSKSLNLSVGSLFYSILDFLSILETLIPSEISP